MGGLVWNPLFARPFNDWEMGMVEAFICAVQNKRIRNLVKDRLVWKQSKDEAYSVKSSFRFLESGNQSSIPTNLIWNPCVPFSLLGKLGGAKF